MKTITTMIILILWAVSALAQNGGPMTPLDKALESARKDQSKAKVFYHLFLNTDIYVPTHDAPGEQNVERRAGGNETFRPILLTHEDKKLMPIFDTLERLQTWAKRPIYFMRISAHDLLETVGTSVNIALNPGTDHFKLFEIDEIKQLQKEAQGLIPKEQKVPAGTRALVGAPAKVPDGLEEALRVCMSKNKEIKAAYLGQMTVMVEGAKPHLVLVLDVDEVDKTTFSAIAENVGIAVKGLLKEGEYLDIAKYDGQGAAGAIVKQVKAFYVRSK